MEVVILGIIFVAAVVFNIVVGLAFPRGPWDREAQGMALRMWLGVVAVAVVVAVLLFGPAALVGLWGFWLLLAVMSGAWWGASELMARHNERKAARQALAERMGELRAQGPLPPWAASIEARQPASRPRGLLARIDDWLGLS